MNHHTNLGEMKRKFDSTISEESLENSAVCDQAIRESPD